eukprot:scaffold15321_cov83-Skeletonema_dohrnii-CCMP3373.AAC.1
MIEWLAVSILNEGQRAPEHQNIANFNFFKTSTSTLHPHPQQAASSDIIVRRAHHHRSSFSAVELLLGWAQQDISSAIRVNNMGTSQLIRSLIETSSIIKAPCHHQPMKISKQNILTSLRIRPLNAMAMYLPTFLRLN